MKISQEPIFRANFFLYEEHLEHFLIVIHFMLRPVNSHYKAWSLNKEKKKKKKKKMQSIQESCLERTQR